MRKIVEPFVHVLLFECLECGHPIGSAINTGNRNVEEIDSGSVALNCSCGWKGKLMGIDAKRHWVSSWPNHELVPEPKGTQDGGVGVRG